MGDPQIWHGEFFPRWYYPSDMNFNLFKPNVRVEAVTYGEFYEPRMLKSPTLTKSVLRQRPLVYTIDKNGLRNRVSADESRIWALGDSFVFGFSTTEGLTWIDRTAHGSTRRRPRSRRSCPSRRSIRRVDSLASPTTARPPSISRLPERTS